MHSSILSQVMTTIWNWFMNFSYPWDNNSFTMFDYFKFCCIVYCIFYFIYHILLMFIHRNFDSMADMDVEDLYEYYRAEGLTEEDAWGHAYDDILE